MVFEEMTVPCSEPEGAGGPPRKTPRLQTSKKNTPSATGGAPQPGAKSKKVAQDDQVMAVSHMADLYCFGFYLFPLLIFIIRLSVFGLFLFCLLCYGMKMGAYCFQFQHYPDSRQYMQLMQEL